MDSSLRPDVLKALCRAARAIGEAARLEGISKEDDQVFSGFCAFRSYSLRDMIKLIEAYNEGFEG